MNILDLLKKSVGGIVAIGLFLLVLLWARGMLFQERKAPGQIKLEDEQIPEGTQTITVEHEQVPIHRSWPGTVVSRTKAKLSAKITARITEIEVDAGDRIEAGDVLVQLSKSDLRSRVQQAKSKRSSLRAKHEQATSEYNRVKTLHEQDAATERQLEQARSRKASLDARIEQANEQIEEAREALRWATIRAPFSGVVGDRMADPGDLARPGVPLLSVHDPDRLRADIHVPGSDVGHIENGDTTEVDFPYVERTVQGTVYEITPVADQRSRTVRVKVRIPSKNGIKPGVYARMNTSIGTRTTLLVPTGAIEQKGQLEMVRVKNENQIQLRHVKTGRSHDDRTEILSGLTAGEQILIDGER